VAERDREREGGVQCSKLRSKKKAERLWEDVISTVDGVRKQELARLDGAWVIGGEGHSTPCCRKIPRVCFLGSLPYGLH
jgi:hypothetical protein